MRERVGERAGNPLGLVLVLAAFALVAPAHAQTDFDAWLAAFRSEAAARGISAATLDAALSGVTPDGKVIELDRRQPEFLQTFLSYVERRATPAQIARGRALLAQHDALLSQLEQSYGVPKAVLVAFWSLETNYGAHLGNYNIPASLATLAFDGRRSAFFRNQLLDALRIIDAGHVEAIDMSGSWAGAMGQMQFMPSTFRAYAIDADGDGRIDLWNSLPDAMHSAANYLKRAGWRAGEPIALEVRLPEGFDLRHAGVGRIRPMSDWTALGLRTVTGEALPASLRAALLLPQGWQGPAFLVFNNFAVTMQWNRSVNYALAVGHLADRLQGGAPLFGGARAEREALSRDQVVLLQQQLASLGFDAGGADGVVGPRTQGAIWLYQVTHGLPADGYPAPSLAAHVQRAHQEAAALGRLVGAPALPVDAN